MARALVLLVVTIAYAGVWLALALLFSIVFRSAATAALVLARGVAVRDHSVAAVLAGARQCGDRAPGTSSACLETQQAFARLSPGVLFNEVVAVVLDPSVRSTQQSMLASIGVGLDRTRRRSGCADPVAAKRADRVAADRRPGGRLDPAVRDRLRRVPAPGSAGLIRQKRARARTRPRSRDQLVPGQTWITATILYSSSTMMISSL